MFRVESPVFHHLLSNLGSLRGCERFAPVLGVQHPRQGFPSKRAYEDPPKPIYIYIYRHKHTCTSTLPMAMRQWRFSATCEPLPRLPMTSDSTPGRRWPCGPPPGSGAAGYLEWVSPVRQLKNQTPTFTKRKEAYCGWTKSCTALKPRETVVCWYLQGNHYSRVS